MSNSLYITSTTIRAGKAVVALGTLETLARQVGSDLGTAVSDVMADYLSIPPTISVDQGAVVMVRVDADLEFR